MRKTIGWIVLVLMAIWTFICWHWYTCKVKGFCKQKIKIIEKYSQDKNKDSKKSLEKNKKSGIILNLDNPLPKNTKKTLTGIQF